MNTPVVATETDQIVSLTVTNTEIVTTTQAQTLLVSSESATAVVSTEHENIVQQTAQTAVITSSAQGPQGAPGQSDNFVYLLTAVPLNGHRAVASNSSGYLIYPDTTLENNTVLGITTGASSQEQLAQVQISGILTEPSWNWASNNPVFIGNMGLLTQTPPTSGSICVIGYAITSTKLFIDKQPAIFI